MLSTRLNETPDSAGILQSLPQIVPPTNRTTTSSDLLIPTAPLPVANSANENIGLNKSTGKVIDNGNGKKATASVSNNNNGSAKNESKYSIMGQTSPSFSDEQTIALRAILDNERTARKAVEAKVFIA